MSTTIAPSKTAKQRVLTRAFARHYVEMVAVMLVGMGVLVMPARWAWAAAGLDTSETAGMLIRMGVAMTLPMLPWMRWRGHGWRPTLEMVGAMVVPTVAAVALLAAGAVTGVGVLMTLEHVAMLLAMLAVMAARPEEYSGHR
jgi:hypothetical protein